MTVAAQREGKRRTVAHMEITERYSDHCACLWVNTLVVEKYSRFL